MRALKQPVKIIRRLARSVVKRQTTKLGKKGQNLFHVSGFVAPSPIWDRRQIWAIRLDNHPVQGQLERDRPDVVRRRPAPCRTNRPRRPRKFSATLRAKKLRGTEGLRFCARCKRCVPTQKVRRSVPRRARAGPQIRGCSRGDLAGTGAARGRPLEAYDQR